MLVPIHLRPHANLVLLDGMVFGIAEVVAVPDPPAAALRLAAPRLQEIAPWQRTAEQRAAMSKQWRAEQSYAPWGERATGVRCRRPAPRG